MKILIFSDSHGNTSRMLSAVADHLPRVDLLIHLGDGIRDFEYVASRYPTLQTIFVKGNAESMSRDRCILDLDGVRFMCIHGHSYGVKNDIARGAEAALAEDCSLLLFGHTHTPRDTVYTDQGGKSIRIFNPGSIGRGYPPSYGVLETAGNGAFLTSHAFL